MKIIHSLLDYSTPWNLPDVYLFTGNPIINARGGLVMGRGAARQVRDSYPGVDKEFAQLDLSKANGVAYISIAPDQWIGWFQVKTHWKSPASLWLIEQSAITLARHAHARPDQRFHMNYPGIGNGKLAIELVSQLLDELPDNVILYR